MNRQQLIGAAVILAVLAGVWASSRDPSAPPEPSAQALPLAAAALNTATAAPSPIPSPTIVVLTFEPQPTFTLVVVEPPPTSEAQAEAVNQPQVEQPAAPTQAPAPPPVPPPAPADASVAGAEQSLVDNTNYQRAQYGYAPYARDETLMQIARGRAADMAARGYFSHHDPVTGEELARGQILAAGYAQASENIFRSGGGLANLGQNAVGWFMGDGIHRASILSAAYTSLGAGVAADGPYWIVVLCFAS